MLHLTFQLSPGCYCTLHHPFFAVFHPILSCPFVKSAAQPLWEFSRSRGKAWLYHSLKMSLNKLLHSCNNLKLHLHFMIGKTGLIQPMSLWIKLILEGLNLPISPSSHFLSLTGIPDPQFHFVFLTHPRVTIKASLSAVVSFPGPLHT